MSGVGGVVASEQEVRDWLGEFADEPGAERMERLVELFTSIEQRYPDRDDWDERNASLSAATQVVLGDDTLEGVTEQWTRARLAERSHAAAFVGAVLACSTGARSGPGSESDLIARTGLARGTVRRALGRSVS